jgi:hypothetical protein
MRTVQLVVSAVSLALASVSLIALICLSNVPGMELAVWYALFALFSPLWCFAAVGIAKPTGRGTKLVLVMAGVVVLLGCSCIAVLTGNAIGWVAEYHSEPMFFGVFLQLYLLVFLPPGLLSLAVAGVVRWRKWQTDWVAVNSSPHR